MGSCVKIITFLQVDKSWSSTLFQYLGNNLLDDFPAEREPMICHVEQVSNDGIFLSLVERATGAKAGIISRKTSSP